MSMERTALLRTLLDMVEKHKGEKVEKFSEDTNLREELGLDSVDLVGLVMEIQERLGVSLDLRQDLEHVQRIGQLLDVLQKKLAARAAA
jgi:acyl carrier protein